MPANFSLSPREREWVEGARVIVDLAITNTGDTAITLPNPTYATSPQPTFTVVNPSGEELHFVPDVRDGRGEIGMIEIAPGATWRGDMCPGGYVPLDRMGDYAIRAELVWNDIETEAEPRPFRIVPQQIEEISPSISQAGDGDVVRECVMLQRSEHGPRVLAALLEEYDPSNAEMRKPDLQDRGPLPEGAQHVYGAYANYSTGLDGTRWIVSTTRDAVLVGTNRDTTLTTITSPRPIHRVLTPLAVQGPALLLPAILVQGITTELAFVRVDRKASLPQTAAMRPLLALQKPPLDAASCLAPERMGSLFTVALLHATEQGGRIQLVQVRPDGGTRVQEAVMEGVAPVGGLAVQWGSEGRIRTCFLGRTSRPGEPDSLLIAEFEFDDRFASPSSVARRIALRLAVPADRVTSAYFERSAGGVSRAVLIQTHNAAWIATNDRPPRPLSPPADWRPVLVPGAEAWYAVWAHAGKLAVESI